MSFDNLISDILKREIASWELEGISEARNADSLSLNTDELFYPSDIDRFAAELIAAYDSNEDAATAILEMAYRSAFSVGYNHEIDQITLRPTLLDLN